MTNTCNAFEWVGQPLIQEHVHGTVNGYGNYKCRCDECTRAWSAASIARYRRRREKG